ncbi:MAG TPA: 3-oxoadipyl-CoA thiolase [Candidatus Acidoferrales bacterium]|jgi:3-oxoadipyl-CoA thiolase|nr:3-oxoadipyl-CoA thiolase [Candidatus Acidoferrales bacterium]
MKSFKERSSAAVGGRSAVSGTLHGYSFLSQPGDRFVRGRKTPIVTSAFICEGFRTPIGRYGGALSSVRADDLAAIPLKALYAQFQKSDWELVDEVIFGCANQSGEDNRNVARMALLLAGFPHTIPAMTVNRLCGSGMEAVTVAARAIAADEISLAVAGGVESMSRAPFVMPKATAPFSRTTEIYDTTLGWRFPNPQMIKMYGNASMPETAENVAAEYKVERAAQDCFAFRSQQRAAAAQKAGILGEEIIPVNIPGPKGTVKSVYEDEHIRPDTTIEALAKLPTPFRENGTVTAGNASGINDGACAMFVASEEAAASFGLRPIARVVGGATAGVEPDFMGIGPIYAVRKLLARWKISMSNVDVFELNEAFAAQALTVTRELGLPDDSEKVNPNGGAIALGHPLGMSGARLVLTAARQLQRVKGRYALASMCIGVGQGIGILLERV